MDVSLVIRHRLNELGLQQRDLATAAPSYGVLHFPVADWEKAHYELIWEIPVNRITPSNSQQLSKTTYLWIQYIAKECCRTKLTPTERGYLKRRPWRRMEQ